MLLLVRTLGKKKKFLHFVISFPHHPIPPPPPFLFQSVILYHPLPGYDYVMHTKFHSCPPTYWAYMVMVDKGAAFLYDIVNVKELY